MACFVKHTFILLSKSKGRLRLILHGGKSSRILLASLLLCVTNIPACFVAIILITSETIGICRLYVGPSFLHRKEHQLCNFIWIFECGLYWCQQHDPIAVHRTSIQASVFDCIPLPCFVWIYLLSLNFSSFSFFLMCSFDLNFASKLMPRYLAELVWMVILSLILMVVIFSVSLSQFNFPSVDVSVTFCSLRKTSVKFLPTTIIAVLSANVADVMLFILGKS